jgi:hypothetical protein
MGTTSSGYVPLAENGGFLKPDCAPHTATAILEFLLIWMVSSWKSIRGTLVAKLTVAADRQDLQSGFYRAFDSRSGFRAACEYPEATT